MFKKLTYVSTRPTLETPWFFAINPNNAIDNLLSTNQDINLQISGVFELTYTVVLTFLTEEAFNAFESVWSSAGSDLEAHNSLHGITTTTTEE